MKLKRFHLILLLCFLSVIFLGACEEGYQIHAKSSNVPFRDINRFRTIWLSNSYVSLRAIIQEDTYYVVYGKKFQIEGRPVYVSSAVVCKRTYSNELCDEFDIDTGAMREVNTGVVREEIDSISIQLIDELKSIVGEENVEVTITKMGPPII